MKSLGSAALALACVVAVAAPAHAGVIFSNFGPGDTDFDFAGYSIASSTAVAFEFTSSVTDYLGQIDVGVSHVSGPNSSQVTLWSDVGGHRGDELGNWSLGGFNQFPNPGFSSVTGITGVHLTAGASYFLQIAPGAADTSLLWHQNNMAYIAPMLLGGKPNGQAATGSFRLIGGGAAGGAPEPASWALLISGFFGAGSLLRRQARARRLVA